MVTAMDGVHEANPVAGAVGQPQPESFAVEPDCRWNVARKDEHMGKAPGPHEGFRAGARRAGDARWGREALVGGFLVRRRFLGDADLDRHTVGIAEPESV